MTQQTPKTIYLKDYRPYPFAVKHVHLTFDLRDGHTIVTTKSTFKRTDASAKEVFLNGEDLELLSVRIDDVEIDTYTKTDESLTIPCASDAFTLEIQTKIKPEENTRLEGLYVSGGNYCTQCEAEGFRRITYFPDRPDVLSIYTVRIEADKKYPILLSNGNPGEAGNIDANRHYAEWHDPFPKPCYLFALVAGDLECVKDTYTTKSGRKVDLRIYVRAGDEGQCDHAMQSLKKSMKWDEDTYGLEYEHDIFNIVAVSDFNMGAMENTSLNIFNTALVLAAQETATDQDFMRVESVIAHEYFHNWSGNRVTCRDWFQLSLKEGLTVFRDQEFSADLNSKDVQRIDDVTHLRRLQFAEDAGPLAHPIRPDNYIEINNFYTMTVYEKGAEVIRMIRTLLGAENYRKGTDLYFSRHDGQAVTCENFVDCMQEASGIDLTQFRLWYSQAGTPEVTFSGEYDESKNTYTATLTQSTPPTPSQDTKEPMHIPVALGLLDKNGKDLIDTQILHLKEATQKFEIPVNEAPTPSILRGFSAPVRLETNLDNHSLTFLLLNDNDGFNAWEAGQTLYLKMLNSMIEQDSKDVCPRFLETIGTLIDSGFEEGTDKALLARKLTLPSIAMIGQEREIIDPDAISKARQAFLAAMKRTHRKSLDKLYASLSDTGEFTITPAAMGRRALRNTILGILSATNGTGCAKLAHSHYETADNMTDRIAALSRLADNGNEQRDMGFDDFYERFKTYPLVIDKYFSLQAAASRKDIINNLKDLRQHPDFNIKNPNRVRSLYASFAMNNPTAFHAKDGSGYEFLTDAIIELNTINPQIAARLLTPLREWKRYTADRQEKMKAALERILATPDLSPDVFEIASKSLSKSLKG
ncbi:MAG: aminopeptidase N [Alphaproteobacteria bacterium]